MALSSGAQTTTWLGSIDSDWTNPGNWSGGVPTPAAHAVIDMASNVPSTMGAMASCRDLVVNSGATLDLALLTEIAVTGSVTINGATTGAGNLRLVGANGAFFGGSMPLPGLIIDKDPGVGVNSSGTSSISGPFSLIEGNLSIGSAVQFLNPASFAGGTLLGTGTMNCDSSVAFSGTTCTSPPLINCSGNWTSDSNFQPTSNFVRFDGSGIVISGTPRFFDLELLIFSDVTSAVPVIIADDLSVNGNTTLATTSTLDIGGNLALALGGTLSLGPMSHTVAGSVFCDGSMMGSGALICDGATNEAISASTPLISLVCNKVGTADLRLNAITVNGDLSLQSGILSISGLTTINGDSTFSGGSLRRTHSSSSLDLNGDAAFSGTAVATPPIITCSGNWFADGGFNPDFGTVSFDGSPILPQVIDGPMPTFFGVTIVASARVTALVPVKFKSDLTIRGQMTANDAIDFDRSLSVAFGAVFNAGPHTHTVGGNLSISGASNGMGTFIFDGSAFASVAVSSSSPSSLPDIVIAKTGGATLVMSGVLPISGSLTHQSGVLSTTGSSILVAGNASFVGGTLTNGATSTGTINVDGSVTFAGTVSVFPPSIVVAGNWIGNSQFNPGVKAVTFDGTSPQTITGSRASFFQLTIAQGARVSTLLDLMVESSMQVNGELVTAGEVDTNGAVSVGSLGTLDLGASTHTFGSSFTCNGNLVASGRFVFDDNSNGSVGSTQPLPPIDVQKVGGSSLTISGGLEINGDLVLDSGQLWMGAVTLNGNAVFNGGSVTGNGLVDVDGDVTFAGAFATNIAPSMRVSGDWSGHPNYHPTSGTITFDPPLGTPSTVSGSSVTMANLTIAQGSSLITAVPVHVRSALVVSGELEAMDSIEVRGPTTMNQASTFRAGAHTHTFGSSLSAPSAAILTDPGALFLFDGPVNGSLSSLFRLPSLRVAKSGVASLTTGGVLEIDGDLDLDSGILVIGGTPTVTGDATFSGGILGRSGNATLIVESDVDFTGTFSVAPPNISCEGNWTANAAFQPSSGEVIFNGAPFPQTIGGSIGNFANLTIALAADVATTVPLALTGSLLVDNGSLMANAPQPLTVRGTVNSTGVFSAVGPLIADGAVLVSAGFFSIDGGSFGSNLTIQAGFSSSSPLTFHGSTNGSLVSVPALPDVIVNKLGNGTLTTSGSLEITGTLTLSSGNLSVAALVEVDGDALLVGGNLSGNNAGLLDVEGDILFTGTQCTSPPNMRVAGNFGSHPAFFPLSRKVTFDGAPAPQTIIGSNAVFNDVEVTLFGDVSTAIDVTLRGAFQINGAWTTSAKLDVAGNMNAATGSALFAGAATHHFGSGLSLQGSLSATGTFVFDRFAGGAISALGVLPDVVIDKAGTVSTAGNLMIGGTLLQKAGTLFVGGVTTVNSTATFEGGFLNGSGTLDLDGDVVFAGTHVFVPPLITCAGSWTGHVSFDPQNNRVRFDGNGSQPILGGPIQFHDVSVDLAAQLTTAVALTMDGSLTVDGSFSTTSTLDVEGNIQVNTSGTFDLGSEVHSFAGDIACPGDLVASGTFVFDGVGIFGGAPQVISSIRPIPNVVKTETGSLTLAGPLTIAGDLLVEAGTVGTSGLVNVSGDMTFLGGALSGPGGSILDVDGDVTFDGADATNPPTIECAGDWSSNANFTPAGGTVRFDGVGTNSVTSLTLGQSTSFFNLDVEVGALEVSGLLDVRGTSMLIQTGASLRAPLGATLSIERADLLVNGTLEVGGGGQLRLGESSDVDISAIGTLNLLGSPGSGLASVDGIGSGGYGFRVDGLLRATDFLIRRGDESGFVIASSATIAPAPNDFRRGTFDLPRNVPNAALLSVERPLVTEFRNLTFQNSANAMNVHNVSVATGAAISMFGAGGSFAGAGFEDDPQNLVAWTSGTQTQLASLNALPGPGSVTVSWTTTDETNVLAYELQQAANAGGPYSTVATLPASGPMSYSTMITGLIAGTEVFFRLQEIIVGPTTNVLGVVSATPFSAGLPGNLSVVGSGPTAMFADIQSAINAAGSDAIIQLQPGTYDSFVVNGTAGGGLKIVPDGSGPVTIDTTVAGPVLIQNLAAGQFVELGGMTIGSVGSTFDGLRVDTCAGQVILDDLSIEAGLGQTALAVLASAATYVQRCQLVSSNGMGLSVGTGSSVWASRSTSDAVDVTGASVLTTTSLSAPSPTIEAGSTLSAFSGVMPDLVLPAFATLSTPVTAFHNGFENAAWFLAMSNGYQFVPALPGVEMPLMINIASVVLLHQSVTDGFGNDSVAFFLPPNSAMIGETFVLQVATLDLTGTVRMSNAASVSILP